MIRKDASKKHRIRSLLISAVLSLSFLASSCSPRLNSLKPVFPKFSPQTSVVETIKRFSMQAESASDYYYTYEKELENSLEEKNRDLGYAEERMVIDSLMDYDYLSKDREKFDHERYEKIEDVVRDISGEAFKKAFRQFDFVIGFEKDFKDWFYKDKEDNKPGIKSSVNDYILRVTKASKIDFGASPYIRDGRVHFRTYARLEDVLGFSNIKTEIGTGTLEIRLTRNLNEDWSALAKYEIEEYTRDESEIVFSISRNYGKNARLTITIGWGEPLDGNNEKTQEKYVGATYIMLF